MLLVGFPLIFRFSRNRGESVASSMSRSRPDVASPKSTKLRVWWLVSNLSFYGRVWITSTASASASSSTSSTSS